MAGLEAKDTDGKGILAPSWTQILGYEYEVRRRAYRYIVEEYMPLPKAFEEAAKDGETKQHHLVIPMSMGAAGAQRTGRSGAYHEVPRDASQLDFTPKGSQKGGGKGGKGKQGGGGGAALSARDSKGLFTTTGWDGRQICFKWNDGECAGECNRVHVCRRCLGKHKLKDCKEKDTVPRVIRDGKWYRRDNKDRGGRKRKRG